jgi:hypothetical protein
MARRSIFAFVLAILAMLALTLPALAGGWAVLTLDTLPREVRAGASLQLGFIVRQHGKTPTNKGLDGNPLKPVLTAIKQGGAASAQSDADQTIHAEARQQGPTGHYVVNVVFPSDGVWAWQITLPTYYVQDSPSGSDAVVFTPLTVLPAAVPVAAPTPSTTTWLSLSPAALRWAGMAALLAALTVALFGQRRRWGEQAARSQ